MPPSRASHDFAVYIRMGAGEDDSVDQHAGFADNLAAGSDGGLHRSDIARHGAKRFAAERHREAHLEQGDVGGLGGGVGGLDERGNVEGLEDAQGAVRFNRLGPTEGDKDVRVKVRDDELSMRQPSTASAPADTAASTAAVSPPMRTMYLPEQIERERSRRTLPAFSIMSAA